MTLYIFEYIKYIQANPNYKNIICHLRELEMCRLNSSHTKAQVLFNVSDDRRSLLYRLPIPNQEVEINYKGNENITFTVHLYDF